MTSQTFQEYKVQFIDVCRMIFNFGMEQSLKRDEEVVTFFSCLEEAKQDNKLKGVKQVENFLIYQKTVGFFDKFAIDNIFL